MELILSNVRQVKSGLSYYGRSVCNTAKHRVSKSDRSYNGLYAKLPNVGVLGLTGRGTVIPPTRVLNCQTACTKICGNLNLGSIIVN